MTTLVFAPNWLGDVVMALPALADIRRAATGSLVVAARRAVSGLLAVVPGVDRVVVLEGAGGLSSVRRFASDVRTVGQAGASRGILLTNSAHSALLALRAGIPERWGYRRDFRGWLLTRAVTRPRGRVHQVDYYRHLVSSCGFANGTREPRLDPAADVADAGRQLLAARGWTPGQPLVAVAPGAAYGGAKRWPPGRFALAIASLVREPAAACVLVGSRADQPIAYGIEAELDKIDDRTASPRIINLVGHTDLRQLVGVLSQARVFLSNDSGAMHLAAALGIPVVAVFGPTDERATAPVARLDAVPGQAGGGPAPVSILTAPVWCRPCMLRECPIDHRCMRRVGADAVARAVSQVL